MPKGSTFTFFIHFHFLVSWHYQKGEYDIILLSELWMKHDHGIIKQELVGGADFFKLESSLLQATNFVFKAKSYNSAN